MYPRREPSPRRRLLYVPGPAAPVADIIGCSYSSPVSSLCTPPNSPQRRHSLLTGGIVHSASYLKEQDHVNAAASKALDDAQGQRPVLLDEEPVPCVGPDASTAGLPPTPGELQIGGEGVAVPDPASGKGNHENAEDVIKEILAMHIKRKKDHGKYWLQPKRDGGQVAELSMPVRATVHVAPPVDSAAETDVGYLGDVDVEERNDSREMEDARALLRRGTYVDSPYPSPKRRLLSHSVLFRR